MRAPTPRSRSPFTLLLVAAAVTSCAPPESAHFDIEAARRNASLGVSRPHVPGRIVVKYRDRVAPGRRAVVAELVAASGRWLRGARQIELLELGPGRSLEGTLVQLAADPDVEW